MKFSIEHALRNCGFKVGVTDGVTQATQVIQGYGEIVMHLHRNYYGKDNAEMCILCYNDIHMDILFSGAMPTTADSFAALMRFTFPYHELGNCHTAFEEKNFVGSFDTMEKYLMYGTDNYVPVIYKHENDGCHNSIWIMYAREGVDSFSKRKVLFHVKERSLLAALALFDVLYNEKCANRSIRGREWHGAEPYAIDFDND